MKTLHLLTDLGSLDSYVVRDDIDLELTASMGSLYT